MPLDGGIVMLERINYQINEEDIASIELLCCDADNKDLLAKVSQNCKGEDGKSKEFSMVYLFLLCLLGNYDDNLYLEGIRVVTKDNNMHYILSSIIKEKCYVITDELIKFIKGIADYIINGNEIGVRKLNISTLDYVTIGKMNLKSEKLERSK